MTISGQDETVHSRLQRINPRWLFLLFSLVSLAALLGMGCWLAHQSLKRLELICRSNMGEIRGAAARDSAVALDGVGEMLIRHEAEDLAQKIDLYLHAHPEATLRDLQKDPGFKSIEHQAGRPGELTGGRASEGGISLIFNACRGGNWASGTYLWEDADGKGRRKFMWIVPVERRTADGVRLSAVATTYADVFSSASEQLDQTLEIALDAQLKSLRDSSKEATSVLLLGMTLVQCATGALVVFLIWQLLNARAQEAMHKTALRNSLELAKFSADIGVILTRSGSLQDAMRECTETIVRNLEGAFARIWTCNHKEGVLELQASAGIYTHIDGAHRRIPIGSSEIGRIAERREAHLTSDVLHDPEIGDTEWARREGLVSFAGHPLIVSGQVVGVMAIFARRPLDDSSLQALATVSVTIALAIQRYQAETTQRETNQNLQKANERLIRAKNTEEAKSLELMLLLQELDLAREDAEQEHRQREQLVSSIGAVLIGLDERMRVTQWNSWAEAVFGLPASYVQRRPVSECGIGWNWLAVEEKIQECIESVSTVQLAPLAYERIDGKPGFLSLTMNPISRALGPSNGLVIIGEEITERKILEAQLSQAQKLESIGQLAAGIAHEINTPIQYVGDNVHFFKDAIRDLIPLCQRYRAICGSFPEGVGVNQEDLKGLEAAACALDLEYLKAEIPLAIEQTLEGVERVTKIVLAMKEFSHPDNGKKTPIDLNRAIGSTILVSRNEWKYSAKLTTDLDPNLPPVTCLAGELNQVILNMIINAAHAIIDKTGNDGSWEKGEIGVSTRKAGEWAEIRISDTGTGIPADARPNIFVPFFTTKEVGRGTGQGLAIAHNVIVNKHGGTITFDTEEGKGTTFTIRLPIRLNEND